MRPTDADLDRWAAAGHDRWSAASLLPAFRRLERDLDLGTTSLHGSDGPVTVQRHGAPVHPLTAAFFGACDADGHPEHADLNDGGDRGWGLVPRNVDHVGRVDTATAYLDPVRARPNLEIRGGWTVSDLVVERGRVVGVQRRAATVGPRWCAPIRSCSAPARWARRRWSSGPASAARAPGRPVALHPAVDLHFEPVAGVELDGAPLVQGALHVVLDSGGVVEVLAMCRPYGRATGAAPQDRTVSLRVSLMQARTVRASGAPRRRIGRRLAGAGLAGPLGPTGPGRPARRGPHGVRSGGLGAAGGPGRHLARPRRGRRCRSTTGSTSGSPSGSSCRCMRPGARRWARRAIGAAVVDQIGRVHAAAGLRIVDTSILPGLPSRGPACLAIAIAEHLAPTFD